MDGFACLLHPVWQKILQNLGILINPDLKLTLSDLGSIRVSNPWRRHELGIYVTSTKEVQRYVVIIHFGSIDRSFYLNTWHFQLLSRHAFRWFDAKSKIESNYRSRQLAKLSRLSVSLLAVYYISDYIILVFFRFFLKRILLRLSYGNINHINDSLTRTRIIVSHNSKDS